MDRAPPTFEARLLNDPPSVGTLPAPRPGGQWSSAKQATIALAVVDAHAFTRECIARALQQSDDALAVVAFDSCESCLASEGTYDLVLFHAHGALLDRSAAAACDAPFASALSVAPVIVLSDVESPNEIIDAFENGARGYIPTADTPLALALEIARLVRAGGTFVPPSGLALRRASGQQPGPPAASPDVAEPFTPRQIAVLHHLKLGKANKAIARELNMSESTVKIHLRNIMKKMHAANRTEVACRAQAFDAARRA